MNRCEAINDYGHLCALPLGHLYSHQCFDIEQGYSTPCERMWNFSHEVPQ